MTTTIFLFRNVVFRRTGDRMVYKLAVEFCIN
jgi:hypothetical protein